MQSLSWKRAASMLIFSGGLLAAGCAPSLKHSPADNVVESEGEDIPIPQLSTAEKADLEAMSEPVLPEAVESKVLQAYATVDPGHIIPDSLLKKALTYYNANLAHIPNKAYLTIVDFKPHSKYSRLFVITMATGKVWTMHVAHGSGSDPKWTGYATKFSNSPGSLMSSLGYYRTAEIYTGKHGRSLRLDGLSSTNSKVRGRAIVVHSATYVHDSNVLQGRSSGCFAVSAANKDVLVNKIKSGSIIYAAQAN